MCVFCAETRPVRPFVGFGGMSFEGMAEGRLIFLRVRELHPEKDLSPARSHVMRLEPALVSSILVNGREVWPAGSTADVD
jgi:hypothetical protein